MRSRGSRTYVYDIENRLVSATPLPGVAGSPAALVYDPLGRLFQVSNPVVGVTRFLYDGDALVVEYNGGNLMASRHVHWPGADRPALTFEESGLDKPFWLHADHQGSIVALSAGNGAATINRYDEYGIPGAGNVGRFQFTGQAWLAELGMYYYKARIYSPTLGRFMQTDPVGYDDQFNLYTYVGNDPVNAVDPDGQSVTAIYSITSQSLLVYDNETHGAVFARAISGGRPTGDPIGPGLYSILDSAGRDGHYRLEGHDQRYGDDQYNGRSLTRLHGMGRGWNMGCISVCTDVDMARVNQILGATRTTTSQVDSKSRLAGILGFPRTESVRNYGTLRVLSPGVNLNYNRKTGDVTVSTMRTGSRLPVVQRVCTMRDGACQ